jgi:hypothetical protein
MIGWLDANCGAGFWAMAPSGTSGVLNDALAIYFFNDELARAFVNRWCIGFVSREESGIRCPIDERRAAVKPPFLP